MNRQRFANSYRPKIDHLENRVVPAPVTFQMRPQFSSINLDPTLFIGATPVPVDEQAPGSLTTGYVGRQQGDLDLTALTIQFNDAGSNIFARISGNWLPSYDQGADPACDTPLGAAPANYGGVVSFFGTTNLALRNVRVTLSSAPIALTVVDSDDWTFPATVDYNLKAGDLEVAGVLGNDCGAIPGTEANDDTLAALGTLHDNGNGSYNINVPIDLIANTDLGGGNSIVTHVTGAFGGILPPSPSPLPGAPGRRLDSASAKAALAGAQDPISLDQTPTLLRPSLVHAPAVETAGQTISVVSGVDFMRPTGKVHVASAIDAIIVDPLA